MNLDELIPYLKQLEPEKCFRSEFEQDAYIEIRYSSAKNLFEVRIERPDYMDKPDIEVNEYTEERLRNIFSSKLASS